MNTSQTNTSNIIHHHISLTKIENILKQNTKKIK